MREGKREREVIRRNNWCSQREGPGDKDRLGKGHS